MFRVLFKLGGFNIYSYGALLALAFVCGTLLAAVRGHKQGIDKNKIMDLSLYIAISSILGARIMFVVMNWNYYMANPLEMVKLWEGGLVFYGGLICAFIVAVFFLIKNKLSIMKVLDIFAAPLALGIAIGRIGCFLNGCCYGKISPRFGVSYPALGDPPAFSQQVADGLISGNARCSLPVLPTQLYLSAACLVIFFFLWRLEQRRNFPGFLFWVFILFYSFTRFIIESLRYYDANFILSGISVSQWISLLLMAISAAAIIVGYRRRV
ncbi:MAG: prolipoprotein diacylglyceryl transferase [Candidatus Omnitrophica bacterium]|jgi:phosphatidylglycerol:prolipoprotein diacylglycerol transferase|nr:prolipoprotein diacylglyceryl transferase [Candidatus Omnitrophota bacterium]MDD5079397.1 prolipoprotein diacylglyceryl transferase [Candidatus Omnitrophota bacterium]